MRGIIPLLRHGVCWCVIPRVLIVDLRRNLRRPPLSRLSHMRVDYTCAWSRPLNPSCRWHLNHGVLLLSGLVNISRPRLSGNRHNGRRDGDVDGLPLGLVVLGGLGAGPNKQNKVASEKDAVETEEDLLQMPRFIGQIDPLLRVGKGIFVKIITHVVCGVYRCNDNCSKGQEPDEEVEGDEKSRVH